MGFLLALTLSALSVGYSAVTEAAECDASAVVDGCTISPSEIQFNFAVIALCDSRPDAPTATEPFNFSSCQIIYDRISDATPFSLSLEGEGAFAELLSGIERPDSGVYGYAVYGLGTYWKVKAAMTFSRPRKGRGADGAITTGVNCRTTDDVRYFSSGRQAIATECSSTDQDAEFATYKSGITGGIYNCSGYTNYWVDSDLKLETDARYAYANIAVQQFDTPLVISENTNALISRWDWSSMLTVDTNDAGLTDTFELDIGCQSIGFVVD